MTLLDTKPYQTTELWGIDEREETSEEVLSSELFEPDGDTYTYQPGDGCDVIDNSADLLWLAHIHLDEITLCQTRNGKVQVCYKGQPILRMRGVELIRTEEGCFSLDYWLGCGESC